MSAYSKAVEADSPLAYWKLAKNSGAENKGGTAVTLSGTSSDESAPVKGDVGATSFDGTSSYGQVPLNLSGLSEFTAEFWLRWDTNGSDDDFVMEHSANANSNTGFNVDWNNSTGGAEANTVSVKWLASGGLQAKRFTFPRPSAGAWHHVVLVLVVNGSLVTYVDGAAVTTTQRESAAQTGTFSNTNLNLMSRNKAALFGAGDLAHLAIYNGALSKVRVEAHWAAAAEEEGGAAQKVTLGQATEADSAQALSKKKAKTATPAAEADSARVLALAKRASLGSGAATETAVARGIAKLVTLVPAVEAGSAHGLLVHRLLSLDAAAESDEARPLSFHQLGSAFDLVPAEESDQAQDIAAGKRVTLAPAGEDADAAPLSVAKRVGTQLASEAAAAVAQPRFKRLTLSEAIEGAEAQSIEALKRIALSAGGEVDEALALRQGATYITLGQAVSPEEAFAVLRRSRAGTATAAVVAQGSALATHEPIGVGAVSAVPGASATTQEGLTP